MPEGLMPEVEFEGPLGQFWSMTDVPMEALVKGIADIYKELRRRGYRDDLVLALIRQQTSKGIA